MILVREKETVTYELRLPINCYDAKIIAVAQCSASDPAVAGKACRVLSDTGETDERTITAVWLFSAGRNGFIASGRQ